MIAVCCNMDMEILFKEDFGSTYICTECKTEVEINYDKNTFKIIKPKNESNETLGD